MLINDGLVSMNASLVLTKGLCDTRRVSWLVSMNDAFVLMNDAFVRMSDAFVRMNASFVRTKRAAGYRLQVTGYRLQVTGCRLQAAGYRLQGTGYRLQGTGYRVRVTGCGARGFQSAQNEDPGILWKCVGGLAAEQTIPHDLRLARGRSWIKNNRRVARYGSLVCAVSGLATTRETSVRLDRRSCDPQSESSENHARPSTLRDREW
jgi:hypothetical protein